MTAKNKNETVTGPLAEGQRWSAGLHSVGQRGRIYR